MADYIYSLVLLIVALIAIELRKSYHAVPLNELRYRARQGDLLAAKVSQAVAYEESLDVLLWVIIILALAGSLIILNVVAPLWLDFLAIVVFISVAFAWLPRVSPRGWSEKLAIYLTPGIVFLLNYLHPKLKKVRRSSVVKDKHTELYEIEDLKRLLSRQQKQSDSRIDSNDLETARKALEFNGKKVSDYARAWSDIHHAYATEAIGPIVLDELHKSGQLFVPVVADKDSLDLVGMLDISRIDLSITGEVKDIMDRNLYYLNEADGLNEALSAMSMTGHPVFVVLDERGGLFGLLTLKDLLSELITIKPTSKDYSVRSADTEIEELTPAEESTDSLKTAE